MSFVPDQKRRFVLIGASNLSLGLTVVMRHLRRRSARPIDVFAAAGLGRSLGKTSRVVIRELPALLNCGIWEALASLPPAPTRALVTDIGNDILYGVPGDQIRGWITEIFSRIARLDPQGVATTLPLASLSSLSERRYRIFRRLLYPGSQISHASAITLAAQINTHVIHEAKRLGLTLVTPEMAWYGPDRIHFKLRARDRVWPQLLASWFAGKSEKMPEFSDEMMPSSWWRWRAQRESWLGRERDTQQPCRHDADGSTLSCF
jgi:hypothetical protein